MMDRLGYTLLIFLFISIYIKSYGESVITISDLNPTVTPRTDLFYYEDKYSSCSPTDALQKEFLPLKEGNANFGLSRSSYWLKFRVKNEASVDRLALKISYPLLDSIDLYIMKDGLPIIHKRNGFKFNLTLSELIYPVFIFYLPIPTNSESELLIRVRTHSSFQIPIEIATESSFIQSGADVSILQGIYYGILLVMIFYNLFIFFSLKEIVYIYYSVCIFFSLFFFIIFYGHARYVFWPDDIAWNQHSMKVVMGLLSASSSAFAIVFLELKNFAKWLFYTMRGIMIFGIFLAIANFFMDLHVVNLLVTLLLLFNAIFMLISGVVSWARGNRAARLFVLAWTAYLAGALLLILRNLGILPSNLLTSNFASIGSSLEVILLSLALADKYRIIRAEKEKAQDALLEVQKNVNVTLDHKVKERTQQLQTETEKTETLLLNILPAQVATELKNSGKYIARRHENVSVLFTDFVNFSQISETMLPELLVSELDTYFKKFDEIITQLGIEKIKTIGDAYLCVAGLHNNKDHAIQVCHAAIMIKEYMESVNAQKKDGESKFELRIGIHSGNLVAGVVGTKKFAYDIWGDTVNIAARMEQHGVPGQINISSDTFELVKNYFEVIPRGSLPIKNKGEVKMYFLENEISKYERDN